MKTAASTYHEGINGGKYKVNGSQGGEEEEEEDDFDDNEEIG